jgi:hypothetical protein
MEYSLEFVMWFKDRMLPTSPVDNIWKDGRLEGWKMEGWKIGRMGEWETAPVFRLSLSHPSNLPVFHSSILPVFQSSNLPIFHFFHELIKSHYE